MYEMKENEDTMKHFVVLEEGKHLGLDILIEALKLSLEFTSNKPATNSFEESVLKLSLPVIYIHLLVYT